MTGGSFVADFIEPDPDQFYRILLTVTDSNDAAFSTFFDVQPIKVNLTLESVPTGVPLTIDGQPVGGPEQSVVGTSRAIQAPATHTLVGTTYDFVSWSDGGAATHTIVTPAADTTFTAQFEISPLAIAIADPSISENGGSTTATVTRDGDTTSELTIALSSSDTSEATVPATVTIPAGQSTSAAFNIDAVDDASVDGPQTVTITASAAGYADVTDTLDVTDDDDADAYAVAETTVLGNITSGDMVATYASDDVYEEITERHSGGRPSNRMSFAEHKWTFDVNSGDPVTFFVEAYRTDSGENDEFLFAYSTNDVDYTDMFTVTKTADDDAYQTHLLTPGIGGTVYVRVIDANRVAGNSSLDTILVDEMFIRSTPGGPVLPSVTITATDADADEEGADPGTFTITRTGDLSGDLTVYYTVGGTATAGPAANQDYNTLGGSVVISSGSPTATVVITPVDDSLAEGSETVTLTLANNAAYLVGGSSSDTVMIADNDTTSTDFLAVSETTVSGKLTSGDLTNTFASDDVYEQITERHSGGNPSNRISFAEHKWTFDVTGGDSVTFFVEAFHTLNTENDDYVFAYSTDDVAYTNMVTVTKTSDDDTAQSYALPSALSGTVYVRVKDADQTQGNGGSDRVFIDRMVIVVDSGSAQAAPAIEPLASVLIPAIMLQIVESDSSDLSLLLDGTHPTRQAAVDSIETIKLMASEPDTNDWLQTLDQALSESEWDDPLCGIEPEDNLDVQLDVTVLRPL